MSELAMKIRGLEKRFSEFELGPLDLNVPKGAIYGYIGPNGAGKTTTIDLIMGMGSNDAGTIEVFGMDHRKQDAQIKRGVGYVSPDLGFQAWRYIDRLVNFWRRFYPEWDDAYCEALMQRFRLDPEKRIATLSFGERTKLSLLLALAHRPALLLLDEPFAGLDAVVKTEVLEELLAAVQDEDRTVFISSHNLDDIERFTDHLGILCQGKLLLEGPTTELVERFRMLDAVSANGASIEAIPGVYVQRRENNRWRMLIDLQQSPQERLKAAGMTDFNVSPVSLEELFVALVRDR